MQEYKALVVEEKDAVFHKQVKLVPRSFLPDNEVLIKVHFSALNYKDALSANGHNGITRKFPHTPGIDASGVVVESKSPKWKAGDKVLVTSYDLGMNTNGGFGEYISVPAEWPVALPAKMDLKQAMLYGTSGFTAALALYKMEVAGQNPSMGPVLVTGASGAVGTAAIALLKKCGYEVMASSGKPDQYPLLKEIGATTIISRDEVNDQSEKPFLSPKWAGAIDTIGGNTLSTILKASMANANIAVCGLVASPNFSTTVYPFIIKGNNLLGVETATIDRSIREELWERLSDKWGFQLPESLIRVRSLEEIVPEIESMLKGGSLGKVILSHN